MASFVQVPDPLNPSNSLSGVICKKEGNFLGSLFLTHVNKTALKEAQLIFGIFMLLSLLFSPLQSPLAPPSLFPLPLLFSSSLLSILSIFSSLFSPLCSPPPPSLVVALFAPSLFPLFFLCFSLPYCFFRYT